MPQIHQPTPQSRLRRRLLLGGLTALAAPLAGAQNAASGNVRVVVPFTPGTGIDTVARLIAPQLSERLKRPFFVENRPGASGNIGTQDVVRAAPDGNTLLVSVNTLVMNNALYPNLAFNPLTDLAPVSLTSWGQLLLVANGNAKIGSLQELLQRARAHPGALNYASPGLGTPHHLAMELLKNRAKISITHISYRGTSPAVADLLGGQIELMFLPIHVALPQVRAGTLKALAISSAKAHPLLPDVPPLNSLKLGDMNVDMWYGVLAPAGTPRATIDVLNKELAEILALPATAEAFESQGMTPAHSSPQAFAQLMASDAQRWAALIRAQGISAV